MKMPTLMVVDATLYKGYAFLSLSLELTLQSSWTFIPYPTCFLQTGLLIYIVIKFFIAHISTQGQLEFFYVNIRCLLCFFLALCAFENSLMKINITDIQTGV